MVSYCRIIWKWINHKGLQKSIKPKCKNKVYYCCFYPRVLCRSQILCLYCRSPLRLTARNDSESLAERFSRRMAPFSGSDQVSAVVKLSLFGRKNSKHEPMKAAHPSACILSCSCQEHPVSLLSLDFAGVEEIEILIEALSARRMQETHKWSTKCL